MSTTVLLVIHLMIAAALVGIVLVQKSEGGALGIGGGGGMFAGRGKANLMSRATAALGAAFFTTSLLLTIVSQKRPRPRPYSTNRPRPPRLLRAMLRRSLLAMRRAAAFSIS